MTENEMFHKFRVLASDDNIDLRERTANNCVEIAKLYADQAVKEDRESRWVSVDERYPLAFETGDWDGRKSDSILVRTKDDRYFVAVMYEGVMDGNEFHDFYDDRDFEIEGVQSWKDI